MPIWIKNSLWHPIYWEFYSEISFADKHSSLRSVCCELLLQKDTLLRRQRSIFGTWKRAEKILRRTRYDCWRNIPRKRFVKCVQCYSSWPGIIFLSTLGTYCTHSSFFFHVSEEEMLIRTSFLARRELPGRGASTIASAGKSFWINMTLCRSWYRSLARHPISQRTITATSKRYLNRRS